MYSFRSQGICNSFDFANDGRDAALDFAIHFICWYSTHSFEKRTKHDGCRKNGDYTKNCLTDASATHVF